MLFKDQLCIVRGGGDLASGVVYRLRRAGFPVGILELDQPRVVRRLAAYAEALFAGEASVGGLQARRVVLEEFIAALRGGGGFVPVTADPDGLSLRGLRPAVLVDARMAKRNLDTRMEQAAMVVGLGPGLTAGLDCHAVVETNRGPDMGRVLWQGSAQADTGQPEAVQGYVNERVLRAPATGRFLAWRQIGDAVKKGDPLAEVDGRVISAPFDGVIRGLIHEGLDVSENEKVGDLDPRGRRELCYAISDKALAVGGGVVEAVLTWLDGARPGE